MRSGLIISSILLMFSLHSLTFKMYAASYPGKKENASPVYTVFGGLAAALVAFVLGGFRFSASPLTLIFGVCNAVMLIGYNVFFVKSAQNGPFSIVVVFNIAGGILVPALAERIFFDVALSLPKILCILVVLASVYMISLRRGEAKHFSPVFIPACIALGLCNGTYGVFLDAQQRLTSSDEREEMIIVTFLLAGIIMFLMLLCREKKETWHAFHQTRKSALFMLGCAFAEGFGANVLIYILPFVNVTVLYTLNNAAVVLSGVLFSCLLFKDKLSPLNIAGCVTMIAALIGVSLF